MNIIIVLVLPYMAMLGCGAPVPGSTVPVELLETSRTLLHKVQQAIPIAHSSCIQYESLKLNSSENSKYDIMRDNIGIQPPPDLKASSENFTLETSLRQISWGLQLHRALLAAIVDRLQPQERVLALQGDIRDLNLQITKMLRAVGGQNVMLPSLRLHLPGTYEVQVAAHLTLLQLQNFGQDVDQCLKSLNQSE